MGNISKEKYILNRNVLYMNQYDIYSSQSINLNKRQTKTTKQPEGHKMKILIIYDSKTGNTKKMTEYIAKGAKEVDDVKAIIKKANETTNKDLLDADGIIVGSPTYYGQMSAQIKTIFDKSVSIHGKLSDKVGAAFTSSGGVATGAETTIISILEAMLIHGMVIQGRAQSAHYGVAAVGEPDEKEKSRCQELGRTTAILVKKLKQ